MTGATVDVLPGPLAARVSRRSPRVAATLDVEQAWATARAWAQRAFPGEAVEAVAVGSVLYRPDGGCTLRYRIRLAPARREVVLLVQVPPTATEPVVRAFPDDPSLPTLPQALDPVLVRDLLGAVLPGGRAVRHCAVDVVRHPRQDRCVLRYRLSSGAGGPALPHPVVFGKVHADGTASAAAAALALLRAGIATLPAELHVVVPRPLGVLPELRLGLAEAIPGRPRLPELLRAAGDPGGSAVPLLEEAVRAAGRTAAAVSAVGAPTTGLPLRTLVGERAAAGAALAALEPVWPEVAARLRAGVASAPDGAAGAPVLAHGDLTPGQLLLDDSGRAGLVDVDTLCTAERALDLGRFLAYLHVAGVRRSRDAGPLLHHLTALFLASCRDACPPRDGIPVPLARIASYRALTLARIGASACWQLKDDRLRAVLDVLDAGDEWMEGGG